MKITKIQFFSDQIGRYNHEEGYAETNTMWV